MQARTRRVMHQHPLRFTGGLETCQYRVGALRAAVYNGDLRMAGKRQRGKAGVARADGDNDPRHAWVRQQRRYGVLKDRFITN